MVTVAIGEARRQLQLSQKALGETLGASRRTAGKWDTGRATLSPNQLSTLARLIHPLDAGVATTLASAADETLESLGLVAPPAPALLPGAPAAPPPPPRALVVDAVVCAAADALSVPPAAVRGALHAAFQRARELQLTIEDVEAALVPTGAKR